MKKFSENHVSEAAESNRENLSSTSARDDVATLLRSQARKYATLADIIESDPEWFSDELIDDADIVEALRIASASLIAPEVEERPANESTPQLSKRGSPNTSIASNAYDEMLEVLREVESYLDDRADVDDGNPNTEMSLLVEVRAALSKVKS